MNEKVNADWLSRGVVQHVVPPVVKQKCPSSRKSTTVMPSAKCMTTFGYEQMTLLIVPGEACVGNTFLPLGWANVLADLVFYRKYLGPNGPRYFR